MTYNPRFARIGEIFIHEEFVTEDQVREALVKQNNFGPKIGETLIKLGYLSEGNLLKALHLQLEYDIVEEDVILEECTSAGTLSGRPIMPLE